VVSKKAREE